MERSIHIRQSPEQALEESARALARASFTKIDVDHSSMRVSAEKRPTARWSRGRLTVAVEPAGSEETTLIIDVEMSTRPRGSVFTSDPRAQLVRDFVDALAEVVPLTP